MCMICDLVLFMYHLSFILRPLSYRFHLLQCIIVYQLLLLLLCMTIISISCIFSLLFTTIVWICHYHCYFYCSLSPFLHYHRMFFFEHVEIGFCADIAHRCTSLWTCMCMYVSHCEHTGSCLFSELKWEEKRMLERPIFVGALCTSLCRELSHLAIRGVSS